MYKNVNTPLHQRIQISKTEKTKHKKILHFIHWQLFRMQAHSTFE